MSKSVGHRECTQPKTQDEERLTRLKTHEEVGKDGILEHTWRARPYVGVKAGPLK